MKKENVTIYNESNKLDLENANINFKNSSTYCSLDGGYTNNIKIDINGFCNYDVIKKIIDMKEKINNITNPISSIIFFSCYYYSFSLIYILGTL